MGTIYRNGTAFIGSGGAGGVELTQAEYDALPTSEKMNGSIYFISDGEASYPSASTMRYDNSTSGLTATSVQAAVDEVNEKVNGNAGDIATLNNGLTNLIIKEDTVLTTSFSAGTIGTRGAQYSWDNPHENDDYKIIGMMFLYIGNSSEYNAQAFYSNGKIYCNFYRAHTGASQVSATLRVVYAKI